MKFKEIIENVDQSEKNSSWVDLERLSREFGINDYLHDEHERMKCYYFVKWYCTDTYVGGLVYFLDNVPVCTSWQNARKADEHFHWISKETFIATRQYLLSLIEQRDDFSISFIEPEEEWGVGYEIAYGNQLLTNKVLYMNEEVTVLETYRDMDNISLWSKIKIRTQSGEEIVVSMSEILVPYNVKK
jgi:hypothetical protein